LTVTSLDRTGQPASANISLFNLDNGDVRDVVSIGAVELRLPKGRYSVVGAIGDNGSPTIVTDATVVVDRTVTSTLDARTAKPVSVTVPAADAVPADSTVAFTWVSGRRHFTFAVSGQTFQGMNVGQSEPDEREPALSTSIISQLAKGPAPQEQPSPYAYFIHQVVKEHAPAGYVRAFTDRDLARVEATYLNQGVDNGITGAFGALDSGVEFSAPSLPIALPGRRTEYYTADPNMSWRRGLVEGGFANLTNLHVSHPTRFRAGQTTNDRVNAAAFGPGFGLNSEVLRNQDTMVIRPGLSSPSGDWSGVSFTATGRIVVERAGRVVHDAPGTTAEVTGLPAGTAPVTVRVNTTRGAPNRLSTTVNAEWTFRSGATSGNVPLALSAVKFAPPVSETNTAPAGKTVLVPVTVQRQPGSAAATARTLTVEVSYDDGATWHPAPVVWSGQNRVVTLRHPAAAGFVSLRAASTDTAGNTVKQTIIRAYRIV
jgi:hypothetical protein